MLSLQNKLFQIGAGLAALTDDCYHYWRPVKKVPCIMWAETGEENSFHADNHKQEQNISGVCDYYTKKEFDPMIDEIQNTLDSMGLTWALDSVDYEDETNLIHYSWSWGVVVSGSVPCGAGN